MLRATALLGTALFLAGCAEAAEGYKQPGPAASPTAPEPTSAAPVAVGTAAVPAVSTPPRPVSLPGDDGPHDAATEWWYYHGHLRGAEGDRFGFEVVVFKRRGAQGRSGYVAHAAVTDVARGVFQFSEKIAVPPPTLPGPAFDLLVGGTRARGSGGTDSIAGTTRDYALELDLRAMKPPVLHGATGYIGVSGSEQSYYYSRTRMKADGTIRRGGSAQPVTGTAWMDHQWGDFTLEGQGGWDWFGLQLDDGTDLMISVVRSGDGNVVLAYGTEVDAQGAAAHLAAESFRVEATGAWTSPSTGATYPMGWQIAVPARNMALRVTPVLENQELAAYQSVDRAYWEGQVTVAGETGGVPVTGLGYVELTGYDRRSPGGR